MTTVLSPVARRAAEAARHLPGKHDQKSHGKGGGGGGGVTVDAIDGRKAEIRREAAAFLDRVWNGGGSMDEAFSIGTKDPYMFAMSRHGLDLGAAAALDLLGYSEAPTVLSAEEFDAFEGAKVTLPHAYDFHLVADPTGEPLVVEEFGRATGSRKSAENMVYGDTHYVGTGVAGPGTYIGQPTVAAQFAGGLYSSNPSQTKANFADLGRPPNQSIAAEGESYTRVKLKPGTKIVTEAEVRKALDQQFDAEQAEWERTGNPDSGRYTALDDAEGRGVSRAVFAAERMGAQAILAQDASDPLRGLVVLDRQALVFDGDFVDPDEAWRAAIRAAAAMAVDDLVRQSRGLALLMRVDRGVERRILDGGQWGDLSDAERARALELHDLRYGPSPEEFYALLVDESARHLSGQHDQKKHAGGVGGGPYVSAGMADDYNLPKRVAKAYGQALADAARAAGVDPSELAYLDDRGSLDSLYRARSDAKALVAERLAERMSDVPVSDFASERLIHAEATGSPWKVDAERRRIDEILSENDPSLREPGREDGYLLVQRASNGTLSVTSLYDAAGLVDGANDTSIPFDDRLKLFADAGIYPAGSPQAVKMFREECVSSLVNEWAISSNDDNPRSLAIQRAVAEEFGTARDTTDWRTLPVTAQHRDRLLSESGDVYRSFVRAQYEETQARFDEWGIDEVTVARGVTGTRVSESLTRLVGGMRQPDSDEVTFGIDDYGSPLTVPVRTFRDVPVKTRPASSWSMSAGVAADFSGTIAVKMTVPVDQILSTPVTGLGCLHEQEVVVLGGLGQKATVVAYDRHLQGSDKAGVISSARSDVAPTSEALVLDVDDNEADWITVLSKRRPGVLTDAELYEALGRGEEPDGVAVRSSARHLPGKHDQKAHGRGGPAVATGDTWDEVSANMGFMPMRPQEAFPERYAPNKAYGVHLKEGEVETRLRTDGQGRPVMVDFTPTPFREYLDRKDDIEAAGLFVEPGDRMTHMMVEAGRRPPEHTFRAVAEDDYQRMVAQGHLDTDGRMNLDAAEGMVTEVGDPSWYLPNPAPDANGDRIGVGPPGRIVRIRYDESDGWRRDRDGYLKTSQAVPFDRVDLVSPVLRKSPDAPGGREVMRAESLRHLAGQHDQKKHAGGGGGSSVGTVDDGLPDGWTMRPLGGGRWESTAIVKKEGTQTSVQIDSMAFLRTPGDWSKFRPEGERLAIAERAAVAVARSIDPLYAKHPELKNVDLRITVDTNGGILKPSSAAHMDTLKVVGKDGSLQTGVSVVLQPSLFAPRPGDTPFEAADTSVMGDHKLGHTAMAMTASAEGLHGDMTAAAPVRSTIVHEMGHVVDWTTSTAPDNPNWHEETQSAATVVLDTLDNTEGGRAIYSTASDYALTSPTEFFAEAFAEWHLRDVAEPSDAAVFVAETMGWE